MADVSITVDFDKGALLKGFSRFYTSEIRKAETKIKNRLLRFAKTKHRYTNRTHNLQESTTVERGLSKKIAEMKMFVDLNKAPYGQSIIKGFKSWTSDPFLNDAIDVNKTWIHTTLEKAVDAAITRMNASK